jgi:formylglycine-generating enzyme required for sulfatase activity
VFTLSLLSMVGCGAAACGHGCGKLTCPEGAVLIPAGTFEMGTDDPEYKDVEGPAHKVTLTKPYCMDRTEVTRKAFRACEARKVCDRGRPMGDYNLNHPATFVSWHEAVAYCEWKHGRLPTEAEWEFAARGTDGRLYPWGNERPTAEHWQIQPEGTMLETADVGTHPKGRSAFGLDDMAGNVHEWVADLWGYFDDRPAVDPVGAPRPGEREGYRMVKGATWWVPTPEEARTTLRFGVPPGARTDQTGFRCAYDPH